MYFVSHDRMPDVRAVNSQLISAPRHRFKFHKRRPGEALDPGHEPPDRTLGPYRLRELLGEGGMGVVYLAGRADLGNLVAIKILRDATETYMHRCVEHITPKASGGQREICSAIVVSAALGEIPEQDGLIPRALAPHNPFTQEARPEVRLVAPPTIPKLWCRGGGNFLRDMIPGSP